MKGTAVNWRIPVVTVVMLLLPAWAVGDAFSALNTTTLQTQTSNNTSAANTFSSQSNGNLGGTNISKVDVHTLLYPNAVTPVYAHLVLWFGGTNHMNVGYSSTDPKQITRQVNDMISRGINGIIIDWYGQGDMSDQATPLVIAEAEKHPGFTVAIMVDKGAIQWHSCSGCNPQQALTAQMQYIEQQYVSSPAYMTRNGSPVITSFNIDLFYSIDWSALRSALSIPPAFLFQDNSGFGHILSQGSYSWVMPSTTDYGMSYLSSFYSMAAGFPGEETVGATYKGFNDSLASWGSGRIMGQQCGQTWLQTFSEINSLYSSANPLDTLQLVTWNDYEEGTEIESGIDNCVTVAASAKNNSLSWTINGQQNTIDHYVVYTSTDRRTLTQLASIPATVNALDLCSYSLAAARYAVYVQAVGKPSLKNQFSSAVTYTPQCH
jgi:hypothetical protein